MDENNEIEKDVIDDKLREAANNELSEYINPQPSSDTKIRADNSLSQKPASEVETISSKEQSQTAKKSTRPIIRTYKSDMEETIQAGHLSSISMAISENNKMLKQAKQDISETKKIKINKNILIISFILVAGGALAIFIPYFLVKKQITPQTPAVNVASDQTIMTTDLEETINLASINANDVDTTLNQRVDESATTLGQVKNFVLTQGSSSAETPITASDFLSLINANVPDDIARSLLPQYMFGMYNFDGNQEFLILKVDDYDTTFSGMLSWETDLWQNFKNLFGLPDIAGSATSSDETVGIQVAQFTDAEFDNENCRVVKDANGNILFLYSIINQNTVVLATSVQTLEEIVSRINSINTVTQ